MAAIATGCLISRWVFAVGLLAAIRSEVNAFETNIQDCPNTCRCMIPYPGALDISICEMNPEYDLPIILSTYSNLTRLHITSSHLSNIPEGVLQMASLRILHLENNDIRNMTAVDLSQLFELQLQYNKMESFPCGLPNLHVLYLNNNEVRNIGCHPFHCKELIFLRLDNNKLQSVPPQILGCHKLHTLDLTSNAIKIIDVDLTKLPHLEVFDFANNSLKSVPCEPLRLLGLTNVDLSNNILEAMECDVRQLNDILDISHNRLKTVSCNIARMPKVRWLDLAGNDIDSIECDMSNLTKLGTLQLSNNSLKSFPCELSNMGNLERLYLSNNRIEDIKCDLSALRKLEWLFLDGNRLKSVPCEMRILHSLQQFVLSHNDIEHVECNLVELTNLHLLMLSYNHLRAFPCELSRLRQLRALLLDHNDLEYIMCNLTDMLELGFLNVSFNRFKSVPLELSEAGMLFILDLSYNQISTFPEVLRYQLFRLTFLYLQGNLIQALPLLNWQNVFVDVSNNSITYFKSVPMMDPFSTVYPSCTKLPNFNLWNNNITHFVSIFRGWNLPKSGYQFDNCMDRILTWGIAGNPFLCDCEETAFYRHLGKYLLYQRFSCLEVIPSKHSREISIEEFSCNISNNCPSGCSCISFPYKNTLELNCKAYRQVVLPKIIPSVLNGTRIELSFKASSLVSIQTRPYLSNATKVILSSSGIIDIPRDVITSLSRNVEVLHLDNNKITKLPDNILDVPFQSLENLRLGGNPWNCSCQGFVLKEFIMNYYTLIEDKETIRCNSPETVLHKKVVEVSKGYVCQNDGTLNKKGLIRAATTGSMLLVVAIIVTCLLRLRIRKGQKDYKPVLNRGQLEDEQEDEGKQFDIFVSYATDDEEYAGEWLIPELERRGFKVCFHRVHFLGGVPIHVNMHKCIEMSKRTLAYFSKNFTASGYSMYEFDLALSLDIDAGTKRLVTIKDNALDINELEHSYASYFRTHTYIKREEAHFWDNLEFTLPRNRMGELANAEFGIDEHAV